MPNVSVPIAIQHRDEIIERLASGELVREIAESLGCSRQVISLQLAKDPEYQAATLEALDARLERYEAALDDPGLADGLSLARIKEQIAHARWKCERRNPAKWGQMKQAIQVNSDGPTTVKIVSWSDNESGQD